MKKSIKKISKSSGKTKKKSNLNKLLELELLNQHYKNLLNDVNSNQKEQNEALNNIEKLQEKITYFKLPSIYKPNFAYKLYLLPDFYKYRIKNIDNKLIQIKNKYDKEYDYFKKNKKVVDNSKKSTLSLSSKSFIKFKL